jgi:hypothetical protein
MQQEETGHSVLLKLLKENEVIRTLSSSLFVNCASAASHSLMRGKFDFL